jgi:hypothetical protein
MNEPDFYDNGIALYVVPWPDPEPGTTAEEPDDPDPFRCDGNVTFCVMDVKKKKASFGGMRLRGDVRGVSPKHAAYYKRESDSHWRDIHTGRRVAEPKMTI